MICDYGTQETYLQRLWALAREESEELSRPHDRNAHQRTNSTLEREPKNTAVHPSVHAQSTKSTDDADTDKTINDEDAKCNAKEEEEHIRELVASAFFPYQALCVDLPPDIVTRGMYVLCT